jgi:hypothetical protein
MTEDITRRCGDPRLHDGVENECFGVSWSLGAQGPETRSKTFDEELRLLPRREVSALVDFVVVHEPGIGAFRPGPRELVDLIGKGADRDRDDVVQETRLARVTSGSETPMQQLRELIVGNE